jgi:hypothetical protein
MAVARVTPGAVTSPVFRVRGQRSRWRYPHERLNPEFCEILHDVNISERGTAESRLGYVLFNSTVLPGGEACTGLWEGTFSVRGLKRVISTPTHVYSDDGTTRVDITGSALTATADDRVRHCFLKDQLILNNSVDAPRVWAGDDSTPTNTAAVTGIPFSKAVDMVTHQNLLLFFGTTESSTYYPTRVRWCDINRQTYTVDITQWPAANRYEVYDGGPKIIGAVDNWGTVWIAKEDGVYPGAITYDALGKYDFRLGEPLRGFHPISKMSLVSRPEFIFGAAHEGLFVIRQDGSVEIVNTDDVNTWLDLKHSRMQYSQAYVRERDHQIRLLCSSEDNNSGHDVILVWDWESGDTWLDYPTHTINYAQWLTQSGEEQDWLGGYAGYIYKTDGSTSTDDGTRVPWQVKMCPNDLGMPGVEKHILNVRTLYRYQAGMQTTTMKVHIDEGEVSPARGTLELTSDFQWNTGRQWNTGNQWSGVGKRSLDLWVNRICKTIAPEWYASDPINIEGYQVEYVPLEGMGE